MPVVDFNVGKWLKTILSSDQGVKALVADRIFPVTISLGVSFPAISYRRLTVDLPGAAVKGLAGPVRTTVRINGWDNDYDSACAVASAVLEALKNGSIRNTPTTTGFKVGAILPQGAGDEYYAPGDAGKDFLYGPFVDFLISYEKT